MPKTHISQ